MAKGLRASTRKRNNAKLRATVFGPAIDARTERLSAKLQAIAAEPRPIQEKLMDVDSNEDKGSQHEDDTSADPAAEGSYTPFCLEASFAKVDPSEMQVDSHNSSLKAGSTNRSHPSRIEKKKATRKARNSIVFAPNPQHKKRKSPSKKKS